LITYLVDDMNFALKRLADLRNLLMRMEQDFGIGDLSYMETMLLYAAALMAEGDKEVSLTELQGHPMTAGMSRSTFFRALSHLVELGYMKKTGPEKRAGYLITL